MSHKILLISFLFSLALLLSSGYRPDRTVEGYAGAYAEGVMTDVMRTRLANDWWPHGNPSLGWYQVHGYIAAMDCSHVGSVATLIVAGREYSVLVADCAGDDGPVDRFEKMNVVAELDWDLWQRLTAQYGKPLSIEVRY